ncbi:hypothetical protein P9112_001752 [Eukaryota sp. TZLM1-RC]
MDNPWRVVGPQKVHGRPFMHPSTRSDQKPTRLCRFYLKGLCGHGVNCSFSHDPEGFKSDPSYKTKRCTMKNCLDGDLCSFAHSESELRPHPQTTFEFISPNPTGSRPSPTPNNTFLNRNVITNTPLADSEVQLATDNFEENPHHVVVQDQPDTPLVNLDSFPITENFADIDADLLAQRIQNQFNVAQRKLQSFDPLFKLKYQFTCNFDETDHELKMRLILCPFIFSEICSEDRVKRFKDNLFLPFPSPKPFEGKFKNHFPHELPPVCRHGQNCHRKNAKSFKKCTATHAVFPCLDQGKNCEFRVDDSLILFRGGCGTDVVRASVRSRNAREVWITPTKHMTTIEFIQDIRYVRTGLILIKEIIRIFNSKAEEFPEYKDNFPILRIFFQFGEFEGSTDFDKQLPSDGHHALMRVELSDKAAQLLQFYFKPLRGRVVHHNDAACQKWINFIKENDIRNCGCKFFEK